jgi:hypothetical protein
MKSRFAIEFEGEPWTDEDGRWQTVQITIGDFVEGESADLSHWGPGDYQAQWRKELRAIAEARDHGALITRIHDPSVGARVGTWTMWREDDRVLFQNRLLFMLEGQNGFDPGRVCDHIGEYRSHTEEGQRISEWTLPVTAIQEFLGQLD